MVLPWRGIFGADPILPVSKNLRVPALYNSMLNHAILLFQPRMRTNNEWGRVNSISSISMSLSFLLLYISKHFFYLVELCIYPLLHLLSPIHVPPTSYQSSIGQVKFNGREGRREEGVGRGEGITP
jgi:hypothetical protein